MICAPSLLSGRVEQAGQRPITGPGATRPAPEAPYELSERKELHEFQEILVRRLTGLAATSGFWEAAVSSRAYLRWTRLTASSSLSCRYCSVMGFHFPEPALLRPGSS